MGKQFSQPPEGPKIGPSEAFDKLSEHRKEQLGDLASLDAKPVAHQGIPEAPVISEEVREAAEADLKEVEDERTKEAVEQLEALHAVLADEEPEEEIRDTVEEDAEPTDEDKQNFLRSVLGDKPYTREYPLFGGTYVVELTDLTAKEEDSIFTELKKDQLHKRITTEEDWELMLTRYQSVMKVSKISQSGKDAKDLPFKGTLKNRVKKLCALNSALYRAVMRAVRVFQLHLTILVEYSLRPDFWKAGGRD